MSSVAERLNEIEESIMSELKDFQQATVERIDYLYKKGQNRILISDEVGLGKTLIARGTIAKFAKLRLDEGDDLVKVVYMCSNATIVDQNMEKLRLVNEIRVESGQTSRLSMQHLNIFKQENDKSILDGFIQLIPLTPNTSFKIHNSEGIVQERALIFAILTQFDPYKDLQEGLGKILQFEVGDSRWEDEKESYLQHVKKCNEDSNGAYFEYMGNEIKKLDEVFYEEEKSLKDSLIELCRSNYDKNEYKKHIVRLRIFFADVSLNKLDPDLIILDGSVGQLSAIRDILKEANIPVIGRDKSGDHSKNARVRIVVLEGDEDYRMIELASDSHIAKLIARIDDESHRFAIQYHTLLKRKDALK